MAAQLMLQIVRRTADFHPTIWGDYFLKYASESTIVDDSATEYFQQLKEEVKMMLVSTELVQALELVDSIQRLGIAYHFEEDICNILRRIKNIYDDEFQEDSLHITSLRFRLLRQEGYDISSEIFKKFTNEEGKFKYEIRSDVQGILSLYEASHLMFNEEPILEEALSFTTSHLQTLVATSSNLSTFLDVQVKHALWQPIWTGLRRLEARHFISIYHEDPSYNEVLLKFASLDFNNLQKLHQKEICELTTWWKDLDFVSKFPYFRDRFAECYLWSMVILFEPKYAVGRKILAKLLLMITVIDDTYDVHGTIEELQAFTKAFQSWNGNCLDQLPNFMKHIYKSTIDIYDETQELMEKEGKGSYRVQYAKNVLKEMCRAYIVEAEWYSKDHVPTMEEYMQHASVTSGQCFVAITSFLGEGDIATEEAFEWASKYPKIIRAGTVVCRFMNDIAGHKFEQKRGHVASCVECYMKQYGASEEEAYTELRMKIKEAWKDINEEFLEPRAVPIPLLTLIVNYTRVVDVLYKDKDNFTHAGGLMKDLVKAMFVDSVSV